MLRRLVPACSLLLYGSVLTAADWPHPRGPGHDGRLEAPGTFSDGPVGLRLAWKVGLGSGYSGIAVADGRAVTSFSDTEGDWVAAFDIQNGKQVWRQRLGDRHAGHDGSDDGPLSSPAVDRGTVFALDPSGRLVALRLEDGAPIWSKELPKDFGATAPDFGFTTTPLVDGKVVVVQAGGTSGRAIVGLDARSGETLWALGDEKVDYQSPALMTLAGTRQVLAVGRGKLRALDAASGKLLWQHDLGPNDGSGSANPTFAGEDRFVVFLGGDAAAFRVSRSDSGYAIEELYRSQALGQSYAPPVYHDGHLYGFRGQVLTCISASTGERVWRSRPPGGDGLILVDGNLVIFGAQGNVVVAAATPEGYRERARVQALEGSGLTWPSFAGGRVFVRNLHELAAVEVTRTAAPAAPALAASPAGSGDFGRWLARLETAPDRKKAVDELWGRYPSLPIVEGELVHFLWRGEARDVGIAGSMVDSETIVAMQQAPGTDLFYRTFRLEPGSRWEYHFQVDFEKMNVDPRNPRSVPAVEGDDRLSELVSAGYAEATHLREPTGTRGKLDTITVKSNILGYEKEVRVWLPPGYDEANRPLPLLVVNDGPAWLERGLMANSLDNLVGQRVAPVVVAFVPASPQWWTEGGGSRTADYARMLATELVPALEQRYRLRTDPASRAVMGQRFFGLTAAYTTLAHPDVFGGAALQSVYLGLGFGDELEALVASHAGAATRFYLDWNRYDERNIDRDYDLAVDSRRLAELLQGGGYSLRGGEVLDSRGWGGWRNRTDRMLETLFPPASAATTQ